MPSVPRVSSGTAAMPSAMTGPVASIAPRYFYDDRGSALFQALGCLIAVIEPGADILAHIPLSTSVPHEGRLGFHPGGSIGNPAPDEAAALLWAMGRLAGPRGALLLGVDLVKPRCTLEQAYDDDKGRTGAQQTHTARCRTPAPAACRPG